MLCTTPSTSLFRASSTKVAFARRPGAAVSSVNASGISIGIGLLWSWTSTVMFCVSWRWSLIFDNEDMLPYPSWEIDRMKCSPTYVRHRGLDMSDSATIQIRTTIARAIRIYFLGVIDECAILSESKEDRGRNSSKTPQDI